MSAAIDYKYAGEVGYTGGVAANHPTESGGIAELLRTAGQTVTNIVGVWGDYSRTKLQVDTALKNNALMASQQQSAIAIEKAKAQTALAAAQAELEDAKNIDVLESLFGKIDMQKALIIGAIVFGVVTLAKAK